MESEREDGRRDRGRERGHIVQSASFPFLHPLFSWKHAKWHLILTTHRNTLRLDKALLHDYMNIATDYSMDLGQGCLYYRR